MIDAEIGLPVWGEHYYSNRVIWAVPMACANQNIADFMQSKLMREMT